tara:strand:+ start:26698 stop:27015 length:318 start_codon:yes stop_codon:yes gene_type:complete
MGQGKYLTQIKSFAKDLEKDFKIKKLILFGSRATGKAKKDSDIDLIIVSDDFKGMGFFERTSRMYKYWPFEIPVDFLCYTKKEFDKLKTRISVVKQAIDTGITIK